MAPRSTSGRSSASRPRRLRRRAEVRDLFAQFEVDARHLVYPIFVGPGSGRPTPIASMPGISRIPSAGVPEFARAISRDGVRAVLLFGTPRRKDLRGSEAWAPKNAVHEAIRAFRTEAPEIVVFTDVCLCAYTTHGHCGVVHGGEIANDETLDLLGRIAVAQAEAGAEFVGPSAMMDHQVAAVREALDAAGHSAVGILAYSAKFASGLYGPFREAEDSTPSFGDRRTYQLDPRSAHDALEAFERDAREGADILMVKPAGTSLDLLARARRRVDRPLAAYQVSGEYAMIKAAAERGWIDESTVVAESLTALRRAGADLIVTYFAREIARAQGGGSGR
ncbi:MAG: porphobilinogen synthase [Thermoplasmata archaeon]